MTEINRFSEIKKIFKDLYLFIYLGFFLVRFTCSAKRMREICIKNVYGLNSSDDAKKCTQSFAFTHVYVL